MNEIITQDQEQEPVTETVENTDHLEMFLNTVKNGQLKDVFDTADVLEVATMSYEEIRRRLEETVSIGDQVRDEQGRLYVCVYVGDDKTCVFVGESSVFADQMYASGLKKTGKSFTINKEGWFE